MVRLGIAIIATTYFPDSHADVIAARLIKGYPWQGAHIEPRVAVISFYLEQTDPHDMDVALLEKYKVPRYPTVAEAITCGGTGVNVDAVVIIGEHGEFEYNEFEQKLYPRRRLIDAAISTMIGARRTVPIFSDKHLAWSFRDAQVIYETTQRLNIPFLAGSTIPLAWRIPTATEWPLGEPMTELVLAGYGPTEIYGFHILEGVQVHAERRIGGETGVVAVTGLIGAAAIEAINAGTVNLELLDKALGTFDLTPEDRERAKQSVKDIFLVEYADGLNVAAVNCDDAIANFGVAARRPNHEMACQIWLQGYPHGHFIFMVRQIESMILNGTAPYPVGGTYLTTGILDAAMRSRKENGVRRETPELAIAYQPAATIPDIGVSEPLPAPAVAAEED